MKGHATTLAIVAGLAMCALILVQIAAAGPVASSALTGVRDKANRVCALNYAKTNEFSRKHRDAWESDAKMALWHKGVSIFLGGTARDLRVIHATRLSGAFGTFATAYREAAAAYDSGSYTRVTAADVKISRTGRSTIRAARALGANICVRYVSDYNKSD
jgi:hypothetical protein